MISKVYTGAITPDKLIGEHTVIVLAVYAILIFAGQKKWLRPGELKIVGAAMIFWAVAWLLQPIIGVVRGHYPALTTAVPISVGLIIPVVAAMGFGLYYVAKRSQD